MKSIIISILFLAGLNACSPAGRDVANQQPNTVKIVVVADLSGSFIKKYERPDPVLFWPLCQKMSEEAPLDLRYGYVREQSNTYFERYYQPYTGKQEQANPWLDKGVAKLNPAPGDWERFVTSVNAKLSVTPAKRSDISSVLARAVTCFQEDNNARNILFLCTDGLDSYTKLPSLPADIEVIAVGLLPDNRIEQALLTTNIKRFENVRPAIEYLISQSF